MIPDIIGIGAPKSGTTSFFRAMSATGLIDPCRMKDADILSNHAFTELDRIYETEFKNDGRPKLEISVLYFTRDLAAQNYCKFENKPKLLFLAREPLAQIKSHYWHLRRQNFHTWASETPMTLSEFLERDPHLILDPSLYAKNLKKWPWSDTDHFLFMTFEEMTKEPSRALNCFAKFCGLELNSDAAASFCHELS